MTHTTFALGRLTCHALEAGMQRLVGIAKERGAVTLADLGQVRNAERGTRNERRLVSSAFRVPRSDFE